MPHYTEYMELTTMSGKNLISAYLCASGKRFFKILNELNNTQLEH